MSDVTAVPIRPIAKGSVLKLWLALAVLAIVAIALAWVGTRGQQRITTASGLQYTVIEPGSGALVTGNDLVLFNYTLRLTNGTLIDSNATTGQPSRAAPNDTMPGVGEALKLMRPGAHYRLWVPPLLSYGAHPPPGAPFGPNDTLVFDIQIVQVAAGMAGMQQMMGRPGGGGGGPEGAMPPGAMPEGLPLGAGPEGAMPPGAMPEGTMPPDHANPHAGAPPETPPGNSL
jgi:hypothetical protein